MTDQNYAAIPESKGRIINQGLNDLPLEAHLRTEPPVKTINCLLSNIQFCESINQNKMESSNSGKCYF